MITKFIIFHLILSYFLSGSQHKLMTTRTSNDKLANINQHCYKEIHKFMDLIAFMDQTSLKG